MGRDPRIPPATSSPQRRKTALITYLSIQGFSTVDRVEIAPDESEEELKEKADTLSRADEIRNFNAFHGSWVYEIEERFVEKLELRKADLVEGA